jgi:hypothetical protein
MSLCGYCRRPLRSLDDVVVLLSMRRADGYPEPGQPFAVWYEHAGCGPDRGYTLTLRHLVDETARDPDAILAHLRAKTWWQESAAPAVRRAITVARELAHYLAHRPTRIPS